MLIFHVTLPGTLSSVVLAEKVCNENLHYCIFSGMIPIIEFFSKYFSHPYASVIVLKGGGGLIILPANLPGSIEIWRLKLCAVTK